MPQEEEGWAPLFSLPMVLRGWGPGLGSIFTVSWHPAQVLCELSGSNQPLRCSQRESISGMEPETGRAHGSTQSLNPWAYAVEITLGASQPLL